MDAYAVLLQALQRKTALQTKNTEHYLKRVTKQNNRPITLKGGYQTKQRVHYFATALLNKTTEQLLCNGVTKQNNASNYFARRY